VSVAGQKRGQILLSERPVLWAFRDARSTRPPTILFGQAGIIVLRGCGEPCQRIAVIPRHPLRRVLLQQLGVPEQLGQVVEGIGGVQLARVDQAHEQVPDPGTVQRLIEQRIFATTEIFP
jgi:hypothetical protein